MQFPLEFRSSKETGRRLPGGNRDNQREHTRTRREPERTNEKQEAIMQEPRANQGGNQERTKKEETKREPTANQEEDQRKARGQPKQSQRHHIGKPPCASTPPHDLTKTVPNKQTSMGY